MAVRPSYLIDTSVLLWSGAEPERISDAAMAALLDSAATLRYSLVSVWEMQIKHSLGKLPLPEAANLTAARFASAIQAELLAPTLEHVGKLYELPRIHNDPFDRMLVAQAIHEDLTFVCPDPAIARYPVRVLW